MSYIRRLPSGKWQATVRGPDGRKHTKTDPLKKVVRTWAAGQEAKFQQGDVRDPRAGDIRVGDWHAVRGDQRGGEDHRGEERIVVGDELRAEVGRVADERGLPHGGTGLGGRTALDPASAAPGAASRRG
jgi:hypothetical protein